jgi:hypothetical protein
VGEYYEVVERATEGSLLEALLRLSTRPERTLYVAIGEGEGDLRDEGPSGYSGLREALVTEGYVLKSLVALAAREIPEDAAALLVIAPHRPLHEAALAAIARYVERGGALVALLEPGADAGPACWRASASTPTRASWWTPASPTSRGRRAARECSSRATPTTRSRRGSSRGT